MEVHLKEISSMHVNLKDKQQLVSQNYQNVV